MHALTVFRVEEHKGRIVDTEVLEVVRSVYVSIGLVRVHGPLEGRGEYPDTELLFQRGGAVGRGEELQREPDPEPGRTTGRDHETGFQEVLTLVH